MNNYQEPTTRIQEETIKVFNNRGDYHENYCKEKKLCFSCETPIKKTLIKNYCNECLKEKYYKMENKGNSNLNNITTLLVGVALMIIGMLMTVIIYKRG